MNVLDRMLKAARVHAPGALDTSIKDEMYIAVDEFLKDSNVWQEIISVSVVANDDTYTLTPSETSNINRLMWVYDSNEIPVNATMAIPGTLVLTTMPSSAAAISAVVALTVKEPVDVDRWPTVPDWIIEKYWTVILDGVTARLLSQKAKPYYDPQLAVYHGRRFRNGIAFARSEAQRNNAFRVQAWRYPQGYASIR